jgi:uncharacterized protein (DUF302 family)
VIYRSLQGFAIVREHLVRALQEQGLKVVVQVSTSEILGKAGYKVSGVHQIFFFRPDFMNEIIAQSSGKDPIAAQSDAIMLAPLKAVIFEEGAGAVLRFQNPTTVFQNHPRLEPFALDMKARMDRVIEELKKSEVC